MFGRKTREIKRLRALIRSNEDRMASMNKTLLNLRRILDVPDGDDVATHVISLKNVHESNRTILEGAAQLLARLEALAVDHTIKPTKTKRAKKRK